jgi:hypothetical protein
MMKPFGLAQAEWAGLVSQPPLRRLPGGDELSPNVGST